LEKLNKNFIIFHVYPDCSVPIIKKFGYKWPSNLQVSYINKRLINVESNVQISTRIYPITYESLDGDNCVMEIDE
jgi:hypothetical protein